MACPLARRIATSRARTRIDLRLRLTFASYNIHKAVGTDGRRDADRIIAVLREIDADIIALQEVTPRLLAILLDTPWIQRDYWVSEEGARPLVAFDDGVTRGQLRSLERAAYWVGR